MKCSTCRNTPLGENESWGSSQPHPCWDCVWNPQNIDNYQENKKEHIGIHHELDEKTGGN